MQKKTCNQIPSYPMNPVHLRIHYPSDFIIYPCRSEKSKKQDLCRSSVEQHRSNSNSQGLTQLLKPTKLGQAITESFSTFPIRKMGRTFGNQIVGSCSCGIDLLMNNWS